MSQEFEPAKYKQNQEKEWDSVAAAWKKWWETFETGGQAVSDRMISLAGVGDGHRVLDVATGIGEPATTVAKVVGSDGRVVATDLSPQMLEIGKSRAKELGLDNMEFRTADAEVLDVGGDAFNSVLCRWGLMFVPNLDSAAKAIHKNLEPGGKLVTSVWAAPPKVPILSTPMGVIREMIEVPAPPKGAPGIFSLADTSRLETALSDAGFKDIKTETFNAKMEWASVDIYVEFMQEIASPIIAMLAKETDERRKEIWHAVGKAISRFAKDDGRLEIDNETILVSATA